MGGAGDDPIDGGAAWDLMYGRPGNDTFVVSQRVDRVFEQPGEGIDAVLAARPNGHQLYADIECLILLEDTPLGIGNGLPNLIIGNAGPNTLYGGVGADTLEGGGGRDVLFGERGRHVFVLGRGMGADVIRDYEPGFDRLDQRGVGLTSVVDALALIRQVGPNLSFDLGDGKAVAMHDVQRTALTAADFILAT